MINLFVFVEGEDDIRFVNWVLFDFFNQNKSIILHTIPYQNKHHNKTIKLIKKINSRENEDYIFLSDLDSHTYPCITSRKNKRIREFHKETYEDLDAQKIFIVVEEIESWYMAGIDGSLDVFKEFDIPDNTDDFTKEQLNEMISKSHFSSRIDFFMEVLKFYDLQLAIQRNNSFRYLIKRFDLLDNVAAD